MISLRYFYRLVIAFIKRFKGIILVGIISGILIFILLNIFSDIFLKNKTEKIGITGRYHTDNLPHFILSEISDGLTKIEEDGTIVPNLASSWESPDSGKTWIFTIAPDNLWQNNEPVTSESIIYEFSDVVVEKPDTKTIIFKLKDPFSPFPAVVSRPTFKSGLLGTGDWEVTDIKISGSYIESLSIKDKNRNKKIYKFYPTEENTKQAFIIGDVNEIKDLFEPSPIDSWNTSLLSELISNNKIVTIFFNIEDKLLSQKSLRQALAYAIDKDKLAGERAISPISKKSWVFNPLVKPYNYSIERANELIEELPDETKKDLSITLVSSPLLLDTAEIIAKDWEKIGLKTTVLVSSIVPSQYQAYLTILDIPIDPDQYSFWHSTQEAANISNYSDQRIDKLLEDGRAELSLEERRRIYLDFQRYLVEDSPATFLFYPKTYTITRK